MFNTGTCGDNRWPRWAQRAGLRGYTQRDFFLTSYLQSSNTVIFRNLSGTKSCNGTRYSLSVQLRSHQVGRGDNRATLNPIEVTKKSSYFHEKKRDYDTEWYRWVFLPIRSRVVFFHYQACLLSHVFGTCFGLSHVNVHYTNISTCM